MNRTIPIAPVRKSVVVTASAQEAFEVFTAGIDRWWPKTHHIGTSPLRASLIEPFVGGRWYSTCDDGSEVVIGHVGAWEPGARLLVSWEISADFRSDARAAFASEIEVRFVAEAPGRTRVEVEHRNFERMGADAGRKMHDAVDGGWPGLLELYARQFNRGAGQ